MTGLRANWQRLTLLLACIASQSLCFAESASHADLKQIDQQITQQKNIIAEQQKQFEQQQSQLKTTEISIAQASKQVKSLEQQISQQQSELKRLELQQTQLLQRQRQQEKRIAEQIQTSFKLGREKRIKLLLNQQDPAQLSRMLIYADYFNKARIAAMQAYQKTVSEINAIKPALAEETENLLASKAALVSQQKQLNADFKQRQQIISDLNRNILSETDKLKQLQLDQQRLKKLLAEVEIAVMQIKLPADTKPFKVMRKKLPWPVKGKYQNLYGKSYQNSALQYEGDIFYADLGQRINAIHYGQVIFADWFRGKGFLIIIDHGEGFMSLYAHNQSLMKDVGEWVSQGEQIATLGNSGGLARAQLYFEIRQAGKPENPKKWLKSR